MPTPIAIAIGAALNLGTAGVALVNAALSIAASLALSFIARKLADRAADDAETGITTELQLGAEVSWQCIFGRRAVAGHLVYVNTYGDGNKYLEMALVISEGYCDSLESVFVNGEEKNLTSITTVGNEDARYTVDDFSAKLVVKWYSGKPTQAHDTEFVANSNPASRWTTNDTLTGMAWVAVWIEYDGDLFDRVPDLLFKIKGLRLYDWRLDSTNGGSGSHRWRDTTTWAWSANAAVIRYNFQRGILVGGERVCGQGVAAADLLHALYTTAADICDETVNLDPSGTEARYEAHLVVADGVQYKVALEAVDRAMAGIPLERQGAFAPLAGAAYSVVSDTLTDDDLVADEAIEYSYKRSRADLVNAVFGSFTDPDNNWESNGFPPLIDATLEIADGGERLAIDLNLQAVTSVTQAQRVSKIIRKEIRKQKTASVVVGFEWVWLEAGDWIAWESTLLGHSLKLEGD